MKTWAKNKIESNALSEQVRKRIKETALTKQNFKFFRETFKPLISQFENLKDDKTKNIFPQNQEMLKNQLALAEGIRANQKSITQGFKQFERLADMKELPEGENRDEIDEIDPDVNPVRQRKILQKTLKNLLMMMIKRF